MGYELKKGSGKSKGKGANKGKGVTTTKMPMKGVPKTMPKKMPMMD